ncbi:MAG: hypothetical protein K2L07_06445 [Lachnospiraceae bacterium]|nr:hypothetical protein [Lachnospiraceae bacterium]
MITRKNFLPIICVVYTIIVLTKLILEAVMGHTDTYYTQNLLFMFVVSFAAVFLLSLHSFLQNIPLLFVIIGQYLLLIAFVEGGIWLISLFEPVSPDGYLDMFLSVSIPYGIGAAIYYIEYFRQIKKMNDLLQEIQSRDASDFSE